MSVCSAMGLATASPLPERSASPMAGDFPRVRRMPDRPAPVTDLAWSPQQAEELGTRVLALWTELLERLPGEPVTAPRTPAEVAPAVALPVPEAPMPVDDLVEHLRTLTFEHSLHLTRWLAESFGLPDGAGGMIMTGGAMANFVGLKCARDQQLGLDVREAGGGA